VIPALALVMLTMVPLPLFVVGSGSLLGASEIPAIVARLAVASWPMNFWPLSKVTGPP